jgi:Fe-S-cluster-containing hydrogenase component 2
MKGKFNITRDEHRCVHCQECIIVCPQSGEDKSHPVITPAEDPEKPPVIKYIENCIQCMTCWDFCRARAITFENGYTVPRLVVDEAIKAKAAKIL